MASTSQEARLLSTRRWVATLHSQTIVCDYDLTPQITTMRFNAMRRGPGSLTVGSRKQAPGQLPHEPLKAHPGGNPKAQTKSAKASGPTRDFSGAVMALNIERQSVILRATSSEILGPDVRADILEPALSCCRERGLAYLLEYDRHERIPPRRRR